MSASVYLDIAECWSESPLVWQVEGRHVRHVFSPQLEVELGKAGADRPDVDDGRPGVVVQQGDVQAGEARQGADQQLQSCCPAVGILLLQQYSLTVPWNSLQDFAVNNLLTSSS